MRRNNIKNNYMNIIAKVYYIVSMIRLTQSLAILPKARLFGALYVTAVAKNNLIHCAGLGTSRMANAGTPHPTSQTPIGDSVYYSSFSPSFSSTTSPTRAFSGSTRTALAHDAAAAAAATKRVLVPVADGTEEIEAVTIIDVLVRGKF